ncbi:hypothetical protein, partial [Burkholderia gladioli]|uniref:hypothetical protein n=1 Tax=Burkholderia gladioli TaxID=28095 RepID=UPI001ABBBE80
MSDGKIEQPATRHRVCRQAPFWARSITCFSRRIWQIETRIKSDVLSLALHFAGYTTWIVAVQTTWHTHSR